jgi:hypothetical protein
VSADTNSIAEACDAAKLCMERIQELQLGLMRARDDATKFIETIPFAPELPPAQDRSPPQKQFYPTMEARRMVPPLSPLVLSPLQKSFCTPEPLSLRHVVILTMKSVIFINPSQFRLPAF